MPEPFSVVAHAELQASPMHTPGRCFNPLCAVAFAPRVSWQVHCCTACERATTNELRRWGHKAAPALLAWRMGKNQSSDPALAALARAGRRHVGQVQSAWLEERRARLAMALGCANG